MSITVAAADADFGTLAVQFAFLLVLMVPGLFVFWWAKVHHGRTVAGPLRVPDRSDLWPVPVAIIIGFMGWMGSAVAYGIVMAARAGIGTTTAPGEADMMASLTPIDFVVLAAVTPIAGLVAGVGFLLLARPAAIGWLGFRPGNVPRGIALGALAAVFGVPATMLAGAVTETVYQVIDFQHPPEHELLKFMKEAPSLWIQVSAIAAAVAIAPLVEEFLFRGLIQTSLMTWFHRFGRPLATPQPVAWPVQQGVLNYPSAPATVPYAAPSVPAMPNSALPDSVPPDAVPPDSLPPALPGVSLPPLPPPIGPAEWLSTEPPAEMSTATTVEPPAAAVLSRRPWASWLAILLTSLLFAVIHPLWTAPIIFVLSVVIGYVYERTGNLWAAIGLHAIFNTISTTIYLMGWAST